MSNRKAWQLIRPQSRRDWQSFAKLLVLVALLFAFVESLFYLKHRDQQIREQTWQSATAIIADARPIVWMRVDSGFGGAMAYHVEVLAQYNVSGTDRQQWITISSEPVLLREAQLKAFLLKGKTCIVRWKPSDPSHPIAEIS